MARRLFPLVLPALLALPATCPSLAVAGAWARGEGEGFVSLSYGASVGGDPWAGTVSAYAEYGLSRRFTLVAKLDQRTRGPHTAELFLRGNLTAANDPRQIALEFGVSVEVDAHRDALTGAVDMSSDVGRPSAAVYLGRGFSTPLGTGWIDMRLGADLPLSGGDILGELDVFLGLNVHRRAFLTFEIWSDIYPGGTVTDLVPGLGYRVTDRLAGTLRVVHDTEGDVADRLEVGTWLEF